jgi:hypothetical protein
MNSILRKVVLPWRQLSGMGNWSYAVITEWSDRGEIVPSSERPAVFCNRNAAEHHARAECASWPYRSEALFLTDAGKYLPLR